MTNLPADGMFGAPPPNAPREVAQPLDAATVADQIAKSRSNERTLAPLREAGISVVSQLTGMTPPGAAPAPPVPPSAPADFVVPDAVNPMPAASESDSPARGIPRPIGDPGKTITGGFGHAGEAQYYPLDGRELLELVRHLMDQLNERLDNDLRFHPAITYPRVRARVVIEIEGYAEAGNFPIEKIEVREKTPIEVARQYGDRIAFALIEHRQEFSEAGEPENPPDRLRDELGLPKPRKQMVQAGASRIMVDVPTIEGSF